MEERGGDPVERGGKREIIERLATFLILKIRPGPNIPLNLPIIQIIIILHLSTPLF